jgi:hypothetical protein
MRTVAPTLDGGLYMDLKAEDGNRYPQPLQQYGIELPAGKTIDAIINPGSDGTYALYDRAASYDSDVTDIIAGAAIGAPTAVDDPAIPGDYTIAEGGSLTTFAAGSPAGVLDNDTSGAGPGPFTANLVSDVSAGTLALNGDGSFTYTPNAFFSGSDTFTYVANDGALDSNGATVTITVTPVNDPPVANDDTATTPPEVAVTIDVVANDTDPDGNLDPTTTNTTCLTGTPVCSTPTNGALLNNGDGTFTYTPNSLFAGTDSFVYEVCDTGLPVFCDTATVNITVINNQPVANDDEATTALNTAVIVDVVANDTDVDDNLDPTSVTVTTPATSGSAVPNGDGTITYTPNTDFFGTDTFVYQVCDTGLLCDTATVTITVENAPPVANDDFATVDKNSGAADLANTFSVTANDVDTDGTIDVTTVVITTGANTQRGGTVVENNDGTVTYTPKRGFRGTDTFQYTVDDNLGATSEDPATVRMNVR